MMEIRKEQIRVAQVLDQDDDFAVLKVAKSDLLSFNLTEGTSFWTLLFVQSDGKGLKADFPWDLRHDPD